LFGRKNLILMLSLTIVLVLVVSFFLSKSKSYCDEFVMEKESGEKVKIEGTSDLDERFVEKVTGNIKREEMARYIESEIEITKKAIENYKNKPEKIKRYQNRLKRLNELKEKIENNH